MQARPWALQGCVTHTGVPCTRACDAHGRATYGCALHDAGVALGPAATAPLLHSTGEVVMVGGEARTGMQIRGRNSAAEAEGAEGQKGAKERGVQMEGPGMHGEAADATAPPPHSHKHVYRIHGGSHTHGCATHMGAPHTRVRPTHGCTTRTGVPHARACHTHGCATRMGAPRARACHAHGRATHTGEPHARVHRTHGCVPHRCIPHARACHPYRRSGCWTLHANAWRPTSSRWARVCVYVCVSPHCGDLLPRGGRAGRTRMRVCACVCT